MGFLGLTEASPGHWSLAARRELHGAFGGTFGGALAAAAVAVSRSLAPGRTPSGIDCRFLRGLSAGEALVVASVVREGRTATVVAVEVTDDQGRLCTSATVSLADRSALSGVTIDGPAPAAVAASGLGGWRTPPGVEIPIIEMLSPGVGAVGEDAIATVVRVPWGEGQSGAEAACLAGDLCVGPPVAAALRETWVPHPNPDLSLRFTGAEPGDEVTGVGRLIGVEGGLAAVTVNVLGAGRTIAVGVATSLLLGAG